MFYNNYNPLEQFEIRDLIVVDAPIFFNAHLSLTNISMYLIISFILILNMNFLTSKFKYLV